MTIEFAQTIAQTFAITGAILATIALGMTLATFVRYRRLAHRMIELNRELLERLELALQAQDPGRDIHERLARMMEATMVKSEGLPDPAGRRAAAMAAAAGIIETVTSAKLRIVAEDEDAT